MATVLVVDDEANIRKFVTVNLAARGYTVVQADNAKDALQMLREQLPEVMVLDLKMPGNLSGLELLTIMAEDNGLTHIPVLVLTASTSGAETALKEFDHVVEVLLKPVSAPNLVEAVAAILEAE